MSKKWKIHPFSDIAEIFNGNSISRKEKEENYIGLTEGMPYIGTKDVGFKHVIDYENGVLIPKSKRSEFKVAPADSILICAEGGSAGRKVAHNDRDTHFGNKLFAIVPSDAVTSKYLYYYTLSQEFKKSFSSLMSGLIGGVSLKKFKSVQVPVPPIQDQEYIVTILNEAFARIDQAVTNAEQNFSNARDLFESYLNNMLTQVRHKFEKEPLYNLCGERIITYGVIKLGEHIPNGVPCLRTSNVRRLHIDTDSMKCIDPALSNNYRRTALKGGEVLVNVRGTLGGVAVVEPSMAGWNVSREVAVVPPKKEHVDSSYLAYWIAAKHSQDWLTGVLKGVAYTGINLSDLRNLPVALPELGEQQNIVKKLRDMEIIIQRLAIIYQHKRTNLTELKQSLLQKAFAGELTETNVIAFPSSSSKHQNIETVSPEFSAHILAFAYHWHESQKREKTFGRVKAQKVLHLTESIADVDLGRAPIKDAAGPNDFQHMLKAEDWARSQQYFEFVPKKSGNGYDFEKLPNYNKVIGDAFAAVKPYQEQLEKILTLILPMDTQQAEVFATVHAAWNNLLLDCAEITDERIIREARENWHPDKSSIPIARFSEAIKKVRNNGLVPGGKAKRVMGQEGLF